LGAAFRNLIEFEESKPMSENGSQIGGGLEWAHPVVRDWFVAKFGTPNEPQLLGCPERAGVLVMAAR
jgi:hypothetical protein